MHCRETEKKGKKNCARHQCLLECQQEKREARLALEGVPEIRMFISQLHPCSQTAIFIFIVVFQQFLPSSDTGLWFILPWQVRDIQQGTKDNADGAVLIGYEYLKLLNESRAGDLQYHKHNRCFCVPWSFLRRESPSAKDTALSKNESIYKEGMKWKQREKNYRIRSYKPSSNTRRSSIIRFWIIRQPRGYDRCGCR